MATHKEIKNALRAEIRKGYTNQDVWKLIELATEAVTIGQTDHSPAMTGIGIEAIRYSLSLKNWRKSGGKSSDLSPVKAQAKELIRVINENDSWCYIQESRRRATEHLQRIH